MTEQDGKQHLGHLPQLPHDMVEQVAVMERLMEKKFARADLTDPKMKGRVVRFFAARGK